MVIFYIAAGINHFINPAMYLAIMPPYISYHLPLVYVSGVCEILFALLLLPTGTRHIGAWLIIALLIAIFPANIQMAITYWRADSPYFWIAMARLPLQAPLIYWAWIYTRK